LSNWNLHEYYTLCVTDDDDSTTDRQTTYYNNSQTLQYNCRVQLTNVEEIKFQLWTHCKSVISVTFLDVDVKFLDVRIHVSGSYVVRFTDVTLVYYIHVLFTRHHLLRNT